MMRAAADAARTAAETSGRPRPLVIGVTVLTSMDEAALAEVGTSRRVMDQVVHLAGLAQAAGPGRRRGLAAGNRGHSPGMRARLRRSSRPASGRRARPGKDDQARTLTPAEAVAAGATYLVIGRPITAAADPRAAAEAIAAETR